jgi:hypothetical protein
MMISLFSGFGIREKEKYQRVLCVKKKGIGRLQTIPPWRFSQGGCGKGGGKRKVEPRKFLGELLSDGEGRGVWAAPPGFGRTKKLSVPRHAMGKKVAGTNTPKLQLEAHHAD